MKCGTTWLSNIVAKHSEINAFNLRSKDFDNLVGLAENMFDGSRDKQILYSRRNLNPQHNLATKLYQHNSEMKFVVVLRNPLDRLISHWKHHVVKMNATGQPLHPSINVSRTMLTNFYDINQYIRARQFNVDNMPPFLLKGLYYFNLENYFKVFDSNQFLFITSEFLFEFPVDCIRKVFRFCGVSELSEAHIMELTRVDRNTASDMNKKLSRVIPRKKKVFLPLDLESKNILNDIFREQNRKIEDFIGKNNVN